VVEHHIGCIVQDLDFAPGPELVVAASSYIEDDKNHIEIFSIAEVGTEHVRISNGCRINMEYPSTSCNWLSSTLLVTTGPDIRVFDVSGREPTVVRQWSHAVANTKDLCTPITSSYCDQANGRVVSTDVYGCCAIWDVQSANPVLAMNLQHPLYSVGAKPDNPNLYALAAESGDVFIFDQRAPKEVHALLTMEYLRGPAQIAWGAELAVNWMTEKGIYYYDSAGGKCRNGIPTMKTLVESICWDGHKLICARSDGAVDIVSEDDIYKWIPKDQVSSCTAAAVSASSFCAVACDGTIFLARTPRNLR